MASMWQCIKNHVVDPYPKRVGSVYLMEQTGAFGRLEKVSLEYDVVYYLSVIFIQDVTCCTQTCYCVSVSVSVSVFCL